MAAASTAQPSNPFIKQLASSDRKIRDRALSSLRTYLHRAAPFSPLDLLKLWKGLFYCMWMSDKPRTQQALARDLAGLLDALISKENLLGFVDAFWKTMAREWGNIDALRMDKYLYLVRCYVSKGFEVVAKNGWQDGELVKEYLTVLEAVPLNARDATIPNGLRYHVIEIYVDELDKVDTDRSAPLEEILRPLRQLGQDSRTKPVTKKVKEALEDDRLADWKNENVAEEEDDDAEHGDAEHESKATAASADDDDDGEFDGFGD
ncbi:hypothetical protein LTR08_008976 [Meristemomyces frigidus]|nr:hypothetical protein LTR08_008976 [Meristemomyces frigidus]